MFNFITSLKSNHFAYFILILVTSFVLKFWFLPQYASYNHDLVRDLSVTYKLFKYQEWVFRGPVVSDLWVYLSPLYFYFIFPFHYIFNFHPLSSPFITVLFSFISGILIYYFCYKFSNPAVALLSSFIYLFSFGITREAGYGLNPNYSLPFTLLMLIGLVGLLKEKKDYYFFLLTLSLSFLISFHASGFFVLPIVVFLLFWYKLKLRKRTIFIGLVIFFLIGLFPYMLLEKKFVFYNTKQVIEFFTVGSSSRNNTSFLQEQYYFYLTVFKNIARTFFYYINIFTLTFSAFLYSITIYYAYKFIITIKSKNISLVNFFGFFLVFYNIIFSLVIKLKADSLREWFFHPVFIPLLVIFFSIFLIKIVNNKYIISTFVIVFLSVNLYVFISYTPDFGTFTERKKAADFLLDYNNGSKFEIFGTDSISFDYLFWYYSKEPIIKSWHYDNFKYQRTAKNVFPCYYIYDKSNGNTNIALNKLYESVSVIIYSSDTCMPP